VRDGPALEAAVVCEDAGTVDPDPEIIAGTDAVSVILFDNRPFAFGVGEITAQILVTGQGGPPRARVGACSYYPNSVFGPVSHWVPADQRLGLITVSDGTHVIDFTYDDSTRHYAANTTSAMTLTIGAELTIQIEGNTDPALGPLLPGSSATLVSPPFQFEYTELQSPPRINRTADTEFRYTVPPGTTDDMVFVLVAYNEIDSTDAIYCVVPACAGRVVLPASIASNLLSQTNYALAHAIQRSVTVGNYAAPIRFFAGTGVHTRLSVE